MHDSVPDGPHIDSLPQPRQPSVTVAGHLILVRAGETFRAKSNPNRPASRCSSSSHSDIRVPSLQSLSAAAAPTPSNLASFQALPWSRATLPSSLLPVLRVHARQILRPRHHRQAPGVALPLGGCPFHPGGEGDHDVLPLDRVSAGVSMDQSVSVIAVASGEVKRGRQAILQKQRTVTFLKAPHRVPPPKESM